MWSRSVTRKVLARRDRARNAHGRASCWWTARPNSLLTRDNNGSERPGATPYDQLRKLVRIRTHDDARDLDPAFALRRIARYCRDPPTLANGSDCRSGTCGGGIDCRGDAQAADLFRPAGVVVDDLARTEGANTLGPRWPGGRNHPGTPQGGQPDE